MKSSRIFLFLFGISFLIRSLVHILGGYVTIAGDERTYINMAQHLFDHELNPLFMPGWPFILYLPFRILGDVFTVRFFVIFIGALTSGLLGLLGIKLFGKKTGFLAGLIHAIYIHHIFFSHYFYAEIMVEFLIVSATYLSFEGKERFSKKPLFLASFMILGLGMLVKHFFVIPFVAYLVSAPLFLKSYFKTLLLGALLFFSPIVIYSLALLSSGYDGLMVINSPIKSFEEWNGGWMLKGRSHPDSGRAERFQGLLKSYKNKSVKEKLNFTKENLYRLWSPGTHVSRRLMAGAYKHIPFPLFFANLSFVFYAVILFFGLGALCLSEKNPFTSYVVMNILILSAMSFFLFMTSRYRIPFMFLILLTCADGMAHFSEYWAKLKALRGSRLIVVGVVLVFFIHLLVDRIPHLREYQ